MKSSVAPAQMHCKSQTSRPAWHPSGVHLAAALGIAAWAMATAGCHLTIDLEDYPYPITIWQEGPVDEDVWDTALPDEDTTPSTPQLGPMLVFTELMVRVSAPPDSFQELGEYIEIKNIGDAPADPRRIVISLVESNERILVDNVIESDAERFVVQTLKPIQPGGYFVFVRNDSPYYGITRQLSPGSYYEYGIWYRSIGLPNFTRTLRLLYRVDEFIHEQHDEVGWRQGQLVDLTGENSATLAITEDIALGVRPGFENAKANTDPANWCYHVLPFGEGPLHGSPGQASPERCL
jgi:hypothetical protein